MRAGHFEILVEEPSMEAFLAELLPRMLGNRATFKLHAHRGKNDLLAKLEHRLRAYASWLPADWRIVVMLDRDDQNCCDLKQRLESASAAAGLRSRSKAGKLPWQLVNRIAIEELEAWYFGDWQAVCAEYPKVPSTIPRQAPYRTTDAIAGGTWEALERILQRAGYFSGGLRKLEIARALGQRIDPGANRSGSFCFFCDALLEAVA